MILDEISEVSTNLADAIYEIVDTIGDIAKDWIWLVASIVFISAYVWVRNKGYLGHIDGFVFYGGMIGCFIMGGIFQYCCKHLKKTLMFIGIVDLILLAFLIVKLILLG